MLQSYMNFDRKLPKYNLFKIFCVSLPQTVTIQRFVHLRNKYTLVLDILKHSLVIHLVNFGRTFVVVLFSSYRAGRGYTEYLRI